MKNGKHLWFSRLKESFIVVARSIFLKVILNLIIYFNPGYMGA